MEMEIEIEELIRSWPPQVSPNQTVPKQVSPQPLQELLLQPLPPALPPLPPPPQGTRATSKICLCYDYTPKAPEGDCSIRFSFEFYAIDLKHGRTSAAPASFEPKKTLAPIIPRHPPPDTPYYATWCKVGSRIYGIGGYVSSCYVISHPSHNVSVFDTKFPEKGWVKCAPLIKARSQPLVAGVDDKVYVFNPDRFLEYEVKREPVDLDRIIGDKSAEEEDPYVYGEVYDPHKDEWTPFRCQKNHTAYLSLTPPNMTIPPWGRFLEALPTYPESDPLIVDNILYYVLNENQLYACDLSKNPCTFHQVTGFDSKYTCYTRHSALVYSDDIPDYKRYLFYLGNQIFCMVWTDIHVDDDDNMVENPDHNPLSDAMFTPLNIIRCLKFNVHHLADNNWTAQIITCDYYYVRGANLHACFPYEEEHNFNEETKPDEEAKADEEHNFDVETKVEEETKAYEEIKYEETKADKETEITSIRDKLLSAISSLARNLGHDTLFKVGVLGAAFFLGRLTKSG